MVWKLKSAPSPNVPTGFATVGRAERVRAVLNHRQVVLPGEAHDRIHVARQSVEVRRHDGPRVRRDGAGQRVRIQRERVGIDVGKNRTEAGLTREFGNHPERQCREDDLRARRKIERAQHVEERHPPVRRGNGSARSERAWKACSNSAISGPWVISPLDAQRSMISSVCGGTRTP
jgi:hypothetical protein